LKQEDISWDNDLEEFNEADQGQDMALVEDNSSKEMFDNLHLVAKINGTENPTLTPGQHQLENTKKWCCY
jgi:hypothetical protein